MLGWLDNRKQDSPGDLNGLSSTPSTADKLWPVLVSFRSTSLDGEDMVDCCHEGAVVGWPASGPLFNICWMCFWKASSSDVCPFWLSDAMPTKQDKHSIFSSAPQFSFLCEVRHTGPFNTSLKVDAWPNIRICIRIYTLAAQLIFSTYFAVITHQNSTIRRRIAKRPQNVAVTANVVVMPTQVYPLSLIWSISYIDMSNVLIHILLPRLNQPKCKCWEIFVCTSATWDVGMITTHIPHRTQ